MQNCCVYTLVLSNYRHSHVIKGLHKQDPHCLQSTWWHQCSATKMNKTWPQRSSLPCGKILNHSSSWQTRSEWSERRRDFKKGGLNRVWRDKVCRRWQRGNIWRNKTLMADSDNTRKKHDVQILSHDSNRLSRRQDERGRQGGGLQDEGR